MTGKHVIECVNKCLRIWTDPGKLVEVGVVFEDASLVSVVSCLLIMLDDQQSDGS